VYQRKVSTNRYGKDYPDTSLNFRFGTVKLIDFRAQWEKLEQSDNPFATVVMARESDTPRVYKKKLKP
jgi:hypothetical protein